WRIAGGSHEAAFRTQGASLQRPGQAAELRQRVFERRRHPLSAEGTDTGVARRYGQHHSVGGGREKLTAECADHAEKNKSPRPSAISAVRSSQNSKERKGFWHRGP